MAFEDYENEDGLGSVGMSQEAKEIAGVSRLVPEYCDAYMGHLQRTLVPLAAEVVLLVRMGGTRRTAQFLGEKLGKKMSRKPIETLMQKVKRGEIVVTQEELEAVALSHPLATRFVQKAPWILDPKSKETIVPDPPKPKGKRGRPKKVEPVATKPEVGDEEACETKDANEPTNPFTVARTSNPSHESSPRKFGHKEVDLNTVRPEHREHLENLIKIQEMRRTGFIKPKTESGG
jgi:hypothetical protein